jgi:hypothetical protein
MKNLNLWNSQVQMVVKAALLAANTSYQVFFLHQPPSNDTYSAIVAIKKENVISQTQQNQVDFQYLKRIKLLQLPR